ncbi:cyclic nucleotide-binding domain-containing protein [Bdellovibrionota bacterium FG-2]
MATQKTHDALQWVKDLKSAWEAIANAAASRAQAELLRSRVQTRRYPRGESVITEGQPLSHLHVLFEGSVESLVCGEKIQTQSESGEIFGEMSWLTQSGASATVRTLAPSEFIEIDLSVLEDPVGQEYLEKNLYRFLSVLLAQRLKRTNEKARLYEIGKRDLETAKLALEDAHHFQQQEFKVAEKNIQDKFSHLTSVWIPASKTITKTADWMRRLETLERDLAGIHPTHNHDLSHFRIVILENDIEVQTYLKVALAGIGAPFEIVSEGCPDLSNVKLLVLGESRFSELVHLRSKYPLIRVMLLTGQKLEESLPILSKEPESSILFVRQAHDRAFTIKTFAASVRKLATEDLFGMEKYLIWGTRVFEKQISGNADISASMHEVHESLTTFDIKRPILSKTSRLVEELLMNVVYDAPYDPATGKAKYNHIERGIELVLSPEERPTLRYACDGALIAISVEDPFGRLKREHVLRTLEQAYSGRLGTATTGESSGGGNGLYQIVRAATLTVFSVDEGQKTEVIALVNLNAQFDKQVLEPSFQFFKK